MTLRELEITAAFIQAFADTVMARGPIDHNGTQVFMVHPNEFQTLLNRVSLLVKGVPPVPAQPQQQPQDSKKPAEEKKDGSI